MCILVYIIDNHVPTMEHCAQTFGNTQIQCGNKIPPSTTMASIPTYTHPTITTTRQPTSNVNTTLGIYTRNPFSFVNSNLISSNP